MATELLFILLTAIQMHLFCASHISPALGSDTLEITELSPDTTLHHSVQQKRQKRLTLYPIIDLDNIDINKPMVNAVKHKKSGAKAWRKHRRSMLRFLPNGSGGMESAIRSKSLVRRREKPADEQPKESIQACLFLRSGCAKIHRRHNSNSRTGQNHARVCAKQK